MAVSSAQAGSVTIGGIHLPSGRSLPADSWTRRHRGIVVLLALHAVGLAAFGLYMGASVYHSVLEGGVIAVLGAIAAIPRLDRRIRSIFASLGLITGSAVLTHLSGGYIEAHFHFFVMLGIIFLYEDWLPYMLAIGYVAVHHGIAGSLDPLSVYNHPDAIAHPWQWATIHAAFILGLSAALIVAWNVIESARRSETRALSEAQDLKRHLDAQEKLAALGSLVSGLAHEVRTPLTIVNTSASMLELAARREPQNSLSARVLTQTADIQSSVERINSLVLQLRRFHALAPDELRTATLDGIVREAMRLFTSANKRTREVRLELEPTSPARLYPLGIHQIVLNLVGNAVEATAASHGIVTIRTYDENGRAVLMVADNGVGMDEETQRRAFDPLFTTKDEGMGLGLDIVKRIVAAHEGHISFTSRPGQGTVFFVRLPHADPPLATSATTSSRADLLAPPSHS